MVEIIAECCQNHNGDKEILKDMVWQAAEAGATYAKIQTINSSDLTFRERFEEGVEEDGVVKTIKRPYQPEFDRLKTLDLSDEDHYWFIDECDKAGIKAMTTAFTRASVPALAKMGWSGIKVASYDCGAVPLLKDLKAHFDKLYISTGATFDEEIETAANTLGDHPFSFLHCVTIYPTPLSDMNLARMNYLRQFTPSIGFSDHSLVKRDGIKAALVAIYLGANVIERHYTILPEDQTKDGPVSIRPEHFRQLVDFAKLSKDEQQNHLSELVGDYTMMIGAEKRDLTPTELLNRDYYRGRFASKVDGRDVFNWEDVDLG